MDIASGLARTGRVLIAPGIAAAFARVERPAARPPLRIRRAVGRDAQHPVRPGGAIGGGLAGAAAARAASAAGGTPG